MLYICFRLVFGFSHGLSVAAEPIQWVELVPEAVSERNDCDWLSSLYQTSDSK